MFILSIFSVAISSYLFLSVLQKRSRDNNFYGFLYFLLIAFAQLVISFEILSLLNSISVKGIILSNLVFLAVSLLLFLKNERYLYKPQLKEELKKIKFSVKKDKLLGFVFCCYILFLVFQISRALFLPVNFGDALNYYLPRCTSWIFNGNINHFVTPDSRELIMPVNMEFLYTWVLLFRKSEAGLTIFSFIGYTGLIYILYSFLKELGFCVRQRLWSIFIVSAFALIAIEMYNPCTDMFIGALILASVFLFYKATKAQNNIAFYFSALSYALAAGTKTTAIMAIPSVFIVFIVITYLYKKEHIVKHISKFCGFFILNFVFFAAYNYILNFIQFHNFVSCPEQLLLNQFRGGFMGWLCNIIKYSFTVFEISGIPDLINFNGFIEYVQANVLAVFGMNVLSHTSPYFPSKFYYDSNVVFMRSFLGIMGMFAFLPSLIKAVKKLCFKPISKRKIILAILSLSFISNLAIISRIMVFTSFNMRYILTFVVIASPIVVYSYIKKNTKFKVFLCVLLFIYFILVAYKMPVESLLIYFKLAKENKANEMYSLIIKSDETYIYDYIKKNKAKNIALIIQQGTSPTFYIEKLRLDGISVDKILLENIEEYKLNTYDYIVTTQNYSTSTSVVNFENRMKYPQLYVSECRYYDYAQQLIDNIKTKPAMVECAVPHEYFAHKGFYPADDIETQSYLILKNMNN
ncbi:glycosyltransferase family 39 protein [bacterium]|nr:glycosyltransferase family 39 protein [bacterium]